MLISSHAHVTSRRMASHGTADKIGAALTLGYLLDSLLFPIVGHVADTCV
jgi:hypothetical protein